MQVLQFSRGQKVFWVVWYVACFFGYCLSIFFMVDSGFAWLWMLSAAISGFVFFGISTTVWGVFSVWKLTPEAVLYHHQAIQPQSIRVYKKNFLLLRYTEVYVVAAGKEYFFPLGAAHWDTFWDALCERHPHLPSWHNLSIPK